MEKIKLSVCVPHYKEDFETCKFLFDSIEMQRGVDLSEIEVLVGNDGLDNPLYPDMFKDYSYKVTVFPFHPHKGVSATRNRLLDEAKGEYVMFCDCDDGFCQIYGLSLLFGRIKKNPDTIISSFVEEGWQDEKFVLTRHDNDMQFIHGKAFKREFLIDKEIRFKEELLIHEDGYFNNLVGNEAITYENIENPFYVWRWNDKSMVRQGRADVFLLKTYPDLIKTREAISEELKRRGFVEEYYDSIVKTLVDAYYETEMPVFQNKALAKEIKAAKKSIKGFYDKHKKDLLKRDTSQIAEMMVISRNNAYKRGLQIERNTFGSFIKMLEGVK